MPTSYTQLIDQCFGNQLAEPSPLDSIQLPDEISLQAVWFNGQFGREFHTTDGKCVRILQFGFWNRTAGPDFLHCSVEIDGVTTSGPLEIDTHATDWENHGHDTNPDFNDVILHVVFHDSSSTHFTRSENHSEIPKVVLPPNIVEDALQQPRFTSATAHIGRCFCPLEKLPHAAIEKLMLAAAKHRCATKAKKLTLIQNAHGSDQALWIALAETLGYRPNKQAMSQLAQRMPIHFLKQHTELSYPLLFGIAGFLHPDIHQNAPDDSRQWLEKLWDAWWMLRDKHELAADRAILWQRSGIRPINHPHRRLATLAHLSKHWPTFRKLCAAPDQLARWLTEITDPFWSHHYTLTSKFSTRTLSLIGKDRIQDLLVNHLLPLKITDGSEVAWQLYRKLPAPATSESINRVSTRLFGQRPDKASFLAKAWQHQALLQIYQDFCLEDTSDCQHCPFPEQLNQITC